MAYIGTAGDDILALSSRDLRKAVIDLGTGYDTLAIIASGRFTFSARSYKELSGVEVLDFSQYSGNRLKVRLDQSMLDQSYIGDLTVVSGADGIAELRASATMSGTVLVAGDGIVQLSDATANAVTIADGSSVTVLGGAASDTITAASDGSVLDGRAGADSLIAGLGGDEVRFGTGYGTDTVWSFDAGADVIALSGVSVADMGELLAYLSDIGGAAVLDLGNGDTLRLEGVAVAELSGANFLVDGAPLPHPPPDPGPGTIVIAVGTTAAEINAIIAAADPGATIVLAAGEHVLDAPIVIDRPDITLKGESEGGTILRFDFGQGAEGSAIQITGGGKAWLGTATSGATAGSYTLELTAGHGVSVGDTLYIRQQNTQEYLAENGWTNVSWEDADQRPFREAILRVVAVDGNTATFEAPIPYDMDAGEVDVFTIDLLSGVMLSDFTVTYALGTANPFDFVNTVSALEGTAAIRLLYADSTDLQRITIDQAASHGLDIRSSLDVTGDDLTISGAHNKGTGGNGYGVQIYETFGADLGNLTILDVRHAVVFSSWHAEAGNLVHVAYTNRDINFHGSPDVMNTVIVDTAVLSYDPAQDTSPYKGWWKIVDQGGSQHAATEIYPANTVTFAQAVAYDGNELIHGSAGGDYLNGMKGADSLNGHDGADLLIGQTGDDVLSGGTGADTFVFMAGDGRDVIADAELGAGGDVIVIGGDPSVTSFAELDTVQVGSDVEIAYGGGSTIVLAGVLLADLDPANFAFDPDGALYGGLWAGDLPVA